MKKALMLSLLLMFIFNSGEASKKVTVQGIRNSTNGNHARIVVDIDGPITYTYSRLSDPDRLFFDLENCTLSGKVKATLPLNDGIIKAVRTSQFNRERVRVVLDIANLKSFSSFTLQQPNRLVIDVYSNESHTPQARKSTVQKKLMGIRRVVIDPGHGGKDPGAIGPGGLREKDVVLDIGRKLGKILSEEKGLEVIYTRNDDVFVPLNERTEIANSKNSDLFISIHVNASRQRHVRGIETYFLNWTNDKEAMRVAARENKISYKNMEKVQGELQVILLDLARNNKNEQSMRLASSVQSSMVNTLRKSYRRVEDHKVKWALFYVLVGAEMPSILAEVSFISNREEEKRLTTARYRSRIAEAIAQGVEAYIRQSTLMVNASGENTRSVQLN